jgi:hypothetical protein
MGRRARLLGYFFEGRAADFWCRVRELNSRHRVTVLERLRLTSELLDLATGRCPRRVARQTPLAGLQEFLGPGVIKALGNAFTTAPLGNTGLATQASQNDTDFLLSRILLAGRAANVLHNSLRRRFQVSGFLSHLHSLMVTMSQKSCVPQAAKSVSQVLMPDNPRL